MRRAKSEYAIQTVTNALRLLEAFEAGEEFGVTELSRRLGLHKNNVFRLLATLEQKGYVARSPRSDRYRLGPSCLGVGQSFARSHELVQRARHVLDALAERTGESAHLGVLREFEVIHLTGVQSPRLVMTGVRVGLRLPVHCTALGKVLIACAPPGIQRAYDLQASREGALEARTPATIVDRDKLLEHLRAVAARGWALDVDECEVGLSCVAAPVFDAEGSVLAALSVSGPTFRLEPTLLESTLSLQVLAAAARLSRDLGHGNVVD